MFTQVIGYLILPVYLVAVLLVGWRLRRRNAGASDFLNASRALPLGVVVASFLAANCGALEIVGLSAVAAQYGVQAFHFYWIGAIPGMVFLGAVMLPVYMRSGARSLPEYLELRFDARVRLLNSWLVLISSSAFSGIGLYAMAQVLHAVYGWSFTGSALLAAGVVLIYVSLGGLRATIYNQLLQLGVIVAGVLPLSIFTLARAHSLHEITRGPGHLWMGMSFWSPAGNLDLFGIVFGLGFVLSFSYWTTDFVQMQRALTAKTISEGRMVPLLAGFGKLLFSLMVVVPALGAASILGARMPKAFDQTLPALMVDFYGPVLLGFGVTALVASLMSHLASNVSAFSALWTEEIYRVSMRRNASERHYLRVGRAAIVAAIVLSVANSYLAFQFRDLMEYVPLVFSLFGAPFFAVFLLAVFTRRATADGAIAGLLSGVCGAAVHQGMVMTHVLRYGSQMNANFHMAAYAFLLSLGVGLMASMRSPRQDRSRLDKLVYRGELGDSHASPAWWVLAVLLLAACASLNYAWR
jgi:SSS family solute:Na+ symporter